MASESEPGEPALELSRVDSVVRDLCDSPFYADGRIAHSERLSRQEVGGVLESLYGGYVDANSQMPRVASELGREIACKKGCHECCYELILVTDGEAYLIARELLKPEHAELLARFEERARKWIAMAGDRANAAARAREAESNATYKALHLAHHRARLLCPFNEEGSCQVYEVRPIVCRQGWVVDTADNCGPKEEGGPQAQMISFPEYERFQEMARRVQSGLQGTLGTAPQQRTSLVEAVRNEVDRLRAAPSQNAEK